MQFSKKRNQQKARHLHLIQKFSSSFDKLYFRNKLTLRTVTSQIHQPRTLARGSRSAISQNPFDNLTFSFMGQNCLPQPNFGMFELTKHKEPEQQNIYHTHKGKTRRDSHQTSQLNPDSDSTPHHLFNNDPNSIQFNSVSGLE